jgi:hypothetical protein
MIEKWIAERCDLETVIEALDILGLEYTVKNRDPLPDGFPQNAYYRGRIGWRVFIKIDKDMLEEK